MAAKAILVFCVQALLAQSAFSQCVGCAGNWGLAGNAGCDGLAGIGGWNGLGGLGLAGYGGGCGGVASTGGGLPVSSASPVAPVGVSVWSDNCYSGELCAGGNLPFLGSIAVEGVLPTAGAGVVSYGCGNGANGIVSEGPIGTGILAAKDFAPSINLANGYGYGAGYGFGAGYGAGYGNGYGLGGCGCGCGGIY